MKTLRLVLVLWLLSCLAARGAELVTPTKTVVTPLATGGYVVALVFDLAVWHHKEVHIIRHFCPPGVEMTAQGFSILNVPGVPGSPFGLRGSIRLNNARNLVGALGEHGFSWYLRNDGPTTAGPIRLEISFVARRVRDVE